MNTIVKSTLAAAGLGAVIFFSVRATQGSGGVEVHAEGVTRRDLAKIVKASGAVDPKEQVNISAHVVGKIVKLFVKEGDTIVAGAPFLDLEKNAYVAERDQWQAQLGSAHTAIRQAQNDIKDAEIKLGRARLLAADGIVTTEQLQAAQVFATSARLRLDTALDVARQADANLVKAKDDLVKTRIYAPLSGRVIRLNAKEGEVVVSGTMNNAASVIGTIADLSQIEAKVDVDETDIVEVALDQPATLHVDANPDREYHGHVIEIGSAGVNRSDQPDVTFFEVKIQFDDPDPALRPSMSVRAQIHLKAHPRVLSIPIQAVVERAADDADPGTRPAGAGGKEGQGGRFKVVFVVRGAKVRQTRVTTGISDETQVEVLSGLSSKDVVVSGPYRTLRDLKDGDAVVVLPTAQDTTASGAGQKREGGGG